MKHAGPRSYQSKDMTNVKVFADKQTDKLRGQKLYTPDLSMQGHKKMSVKQCLSPNATF